MNMHHRIAALALIGAMPGEGAICIPNATETKDWPLVIKGVPGRHSRIASGGSRARGKAKRYARTMGRSMRRR